MEFSEPYLLNIPREIRNNIYNHLSREIVLEWEYIHVPREVEAAGTKQYKVEVCVHNMPILNALRAHWQLRDEYKAAECFTDLAVTLSLNLSTSRTPIDFNDRDPDSEVTQPPHNLVTGERLDEILAQVSHITLFFELKSQFHAPAGERGRDQLGVIALTTLLRRKTPRLQTFRIAQQGQVQPINNNDLESRLTRAALRTAFFSLSSLVTESLLLLQRGEGYRVGYDSFTSRDIPAVMGSYSLSNPLFHDVHKLSVYLYANKQLIEKSKHYWHADEIIEHWPREEYPEKDLEEMPSEKANTVRRYPRELVNWVEKRGVEEVKAWVEMLEQPNV